MAELVDGGGGVGEDVGCGWVVAVVTVEAVGLVADGDVAAVGNASTGILNKEATDTKITRDFFTPK